MIRFALIIFMAFYHQASYQDTNENFINHSSPTAARLSGGNMKTMKFNSEAATEAKVMHVILANGGDAITSCDADDPSYYGNNVPSSWDMGLIKALALEYRMKVVVLKKYDCESNWSIKEDFEDIDNSKGLDVMGYFKGIDDATLFDTVEDVEDAYNEYIDNLKDQYASDQDILLDELTKAQKGKDKIVEQVKHKNPSDFVMIWNDDADSYEVLHKFSTILYDGFNQVSYALGLVLKED